MRQLIHVKLADCIIFLLVLYYIKFLLFSASAYTTMDRLYAFYFLYNNPKSTAIITYLGSIYP